MTNQIAIVDPFVKNPAVQCFNNLVGLLKLPATYHMPSFAGPGSLIREAPRTRAYILLGSASHVHEKLPWQQHLSDFLLSELYAGKPVLGCCFGHQLICHALGSSVGFHYENEDKISGTRQIKIQKNFWNFKQGESFTLGVTHRQVVRNLAPGLISVNEGFPNDIVIHEKLPFLGTQAHPEASDYFCRNDIQDLSQEDQSLAQTDGGRFIQRFFSYFQI